MRCQRVKEQSSGCRVLEDKKKNLEIEQHLLKRHEYRQELVEWEQISQVLGQLLAIDPPPELLEAVMREVSRLEEERARSIPRRLNRRFRWLQERELSR